MAKATLDNPVNLSVYDLGILITDPRQLEEVKNLITEYSIKIDTPTQSDVEAIVEQYSILKARKIDAFTWISAIITEVSKKSETKQYIGYIIGIIRNRMTFGWGTSRSDEEILTVNAINRVLGSNLSLDGTVEVYKLMGEYGATKIAFAMNQLTVEGAYLKDLEIRLKEQEAYLHSM
jgi:hypothetical protein